MSAANQHLRLCIIDEVEIFEHSDLLQTVESSVSVCVEPQQFFFKLSVFHAPSEHLAVVNRSGAAECHCCPGDGEILLGLPCRRHLISGCMQPYLSCTSISPVYCQERV